MTSKFGGWLASYVAPTKRFNPQMLRYIFAHLVKTRFGGNQKKAYTTLRTARPRRNPRTGKPVVPFNKNSLPKVLHDEVQITYQMLESFAVEAEVPTWLLLMFSRALSDDIDSRKPESRTSEAERQAVELNIERTRRFLMALSTVDRTRPMVLSDLDIWIELYQWGKAPQGVLDLGAPENNGNAAKTEGS